MLQAMTAMRTILFVGCGDGLEDPNLGALLWKPMQSTTIGYE
jgi:hypothetical protein